MKTRLISSTWTLVASTVVSLLGCRGAALAQLPPHDLPVVTVTAPDPTANESGDLGKLRLFRAGPTNLTLNVYWFITGSATWGVDYQALAPSVNIPAGVREVVVPVIPLADHLLEGLETVEARLFYPPGDGPQTYLIGFPSNAVVTIEDNEVSTNHPPKVSLLAPTNGAVFVYGLPFQILADATDPDEHDYVDRVEFFDGEISLGIRTNCLPCAGPLPPFVLFASLSTGHHVLRAKATDSRGASSVSAPVEISVTVPSPPVVTIQATHPNAVEPGNAGFFAPGVFRISRTGPTDFALPVYYSIHGTASNAVDYVALSNQVVIPIGQAWANVMIMPLGDNVREGTETVALRLEDIACPTIYPPPRECYAVGMPREAVVNIADSEQLTNHPPMVNLLNPPNEAVFPTPANIHLVAYAEDQEDAFDVKVEFFQGEQSLGIGTFIPTACPSPYCPNFALTWSNVPPGDHVLTARATDHTGAVGVSAPVHVTVREPATNLPPKVRLTKPADGMTFVSPAIVGIRAETLDPDGYVDHVEYYADEHLIGEETRLFFAAPPPGQVHVYELGWTNPPPGRHVLTVKARDELGATGLSLPVVIWVSETNRPPATNTPPIVSVYATDSIASEGTNCLRWRDWPGSAGFGGTNTATFVIRRSGPTNDNLTVHYRVGGTASNGLDYVWLPGAVTIPAGRRAVEFKLVPLEDRLPEPLETVVLELHVPAELPDNVPPYLIGRPARAAAVIVDNDAPRPITRVLPDREFHFTKPGPNGSWWRIESSRDLRNWSVLGTNQVTEGALHFVDPDADEKSEGFYRAVPAEAPSD